MTNSSSNSTQKISSSQSTLNGLFKVLRPFNSTLAGLATVIGIIIATGINEETSRYLPEIFLAALATAFIAAGGYVINDYFDLEIDKINQPHRPLPSNLITPKQAYNFALTLFSLGFILSIILAIIEKSGLLAKVITPFLALFGIFCLYSYASFFKRVGGVGNLIVTLLVLIPLAYGGLIIDEFIQSLYPIIVAFTLMLGREIVKDVEDVEGDLQGGKAIKTLPMIIGIKPTMRLAQLLLITLILTSPIAFFMSDIVIFQSWGLMICIFIVDILAFYALINLRGKDEAEIMKRATLSKRLLKSAMATGAIGLLISSLTPFSQIGL